jgi:HlyD family secretion protein
MLMADTTSSVSAKPLATPQGKSKPEVPPHPTVAPKKAAKSKWLRPLLIVLGIMMLAGVGDWYWWQQQLNALPQGIAMANGRLESEQVEIATKYAGRIAVVLAREGQMVDTGEVVARMDTVELEGQLRSAQASVVRSEHEKTQAEALIV